MAARNLCYEVQAALLCFFPAVYDAAVAARQLKDGDPEVFSQNLRWGNSPKIVRTILYNSGIKTMRSILSYMSQT